MTKNSAKEKQQAKDLDYGQPAREAADQGNPVTLGEEKGSYADQHKKKLKGNKTQSS